MATLKITSDMDSKPFNRGVNKMENRTKRFSKQVTKLGATIAAAFSARVIAGFVKESINAAATIEDMQIQFKALGKSSAEAAAIMENLAQFSAKTPFKLEDIAEASRLLMLFSQGVLGTEESLTLIGDAAAAVGQNLSDVSMWVGRLYAGLQAGAPIGEASMRLMEMGVITPDVKQKLQDMTKAGADSAEMWKFFSNELASFEGQMKQRSESINGLVSTMQDNWRLAMAEMGKDLEPLTKKVVKFATKVGQALKDSRKNAADIAVAGGGGRFGFLKGIVAGTTGIGKEDATRRLAQVRDMEAANKKAAETQQAALEKEAAARAEIAQTQKKQLDLNEKLGKAKKTVETARLTAGSRSGALASDRLAKIGGFLGGAAAPEQANADKQLQVLKATKAAIEKQPKELAAALREFFGLGSI